MARFLMCVSVLVIGVGCSPTPQPESSLMQDDLHDHEKMVAHHKKMLSALSPELLAEMAGAESMLQPGSYETLYLPARIMDDEIQNALVHVRWAWGNTGPCSRFLLCLTYIDHVEFKWSNGQISFGPRIQRLTTSAHDCIKNAKDAINRGETALAVEWVMASQIHNPPVKEWLRQHPDAVIAAVKMVA